MKRSRQVALARTLCVMSVISVLHVAVPLMGQPAGDTTARVEKLADDVYAIIHQDATEEWPHGNTGVVIGDNGVLVIDATYLPSRAKADIALIRGLTNKPVRYLVNTHWHYDHIDGNGAYLAAFPDITIISHHDTRRIMASNAGRYPKATAAPGSIQFQAIDSLRARLAQGKDSAGRSLTAVAKAALLQNIAERETEVREFATLVPVLPNATFDSELTIWLGSREVELRHWGRANTPGDVVAFLPAEGVLFTGDLVVHPVPYAYNSSPVEWIRALRQLEALPATTIVPGHGAVMHDMRYVRAVRELLEYVVENVADMAATGATVAEIRTRLDLSTFKRAFAGTDALQAEVWNDSIVRALVQRAYDSARGSN